MVLAMKLFTRISPLESLFYEDSYMFSHPPCLSLKLYLLEVLCLPLNIVHLLKYICDNCIEFTFLGHKFVFLLKCESGIF